MTAEAPTARVRSYTAPMWLSMWAVCAMLLPALASAAAASRARQGSFLARVISMQGVRGHVKPSLNDTISSRYLLDVDQAIKNARNTATLASAAPPAGPAPPSLDPYGKVIESKGVSQDVSPEQLTSVEAIRKKVNHPVFQDADIHGKEDKDNNFRLLSYDMDLGANLLRGLSAEPTSTSPPSQRMASEQFVAQCPMLAVADTMSITAPHCGDQMGEWTDPVTQRTILRWDTLSDGGIRFSVDSAVAGKGAVMAAELTQDFSLTGTYFELTNCMGVMRYMIEESVTKVDNMGKSITSTIHSHDVRLLTQAFFYTYSIIAPNGRVVARTNLFRLGQNEVNVTMVKDEVSSGALIATAMKKGTWNVRDWQKCGGLKHEWIVDFKLSGRDMDMVATVVDLRVASAALLTLAAFREGTASTKSGVSRIGELNMLKSLALAVVILLLLIGLLALLDGIVRGRRVDAKMRRICFRFEALFLPRHSAPKRATAFGQNF